MKGKGDHTVRRTITFLVTVFSLSAFTQGPVQKEPIKLWVLDGFGEVHTLPGPEIIIDLPGGVTMEMILIPAGSFMMGSDDPGWSDSYEQPVHEVNIVYDFYMGKFEVTQAQWLALMGSWPDTAPSSRYGVGDDYPAYFISWSNCQDFITALNQHITDTGQGHATFRLPSEAEWEYACRAGTTTRFYFGDSNCSSSRDNDAFNSCDLDSYAWWGGNKTPYGSKPAGGKLPNAFGLFDMHGNVYEWCQDSWHDDYTGAPADGSAWESPGRLYKPVRGGPWSYNARYCRSASRLYSYHSYSVYLIGVRVVRELE